MSTHSTTVWRESLRTLGQSLRRPEQAALRWHKRNVPANPMQKPHAIGEIGSATQASSPSQTLFLALFLHALLGMAAYGLTLQMNGGPLTMLRNAWLMPITIGLSWCLAFPSLYIINTALGSRIDFSTTLLTILLTLSIGALAMLTLVPIHWFFSITLPLPEQRWIVHVTSLCLVGICMADVFLRVMRALEPDHSPLYAVIWILLVGLISFEMSALLRLIHTPT